VPIFPCNAGFYTLPTNFFSARYKTAPYIEPIFVSVGQEPDPPKFFGRHNYGVPDFRSGKGKTIRYAEFSVEQ